MVVDPKKSLRSNKKLIESVAVTVQYFKEHKMSRSRTQNAMRNFFSGTVMKLYQVLVPFIMRTAMIYLMGVEYTGLSSLFNSILQVLNMAELGVGTAMVFSMYRPAIEKDQPTFCSLLNLYRKYYFRIGTVIACIGMVLLPVIPRLIKGEVPPDINLQVIYLLNLAVTVSSYWFFAYRISVLTAHQRMDVGNKIRLAAEVVANLLQITSLFLFHNYYVYLCISLLKTVVSNLLISKKAEKMYPDYRPRGEVEPGLKQKIDNRVRDVFTAKIGSTIVNSADSVVISMFLGLRALTIYQNYYFILSSISGFIAILFQSVVPGIGHSLIQYSRRKVFDEMKLFMLLIGWTTGFCTCCFACLYQPFMELWVGKELMLSYSAVVCFCLYFYVYQFNILLNTYKDAAGIWKTDKYRTLLTALSNLAMNLLTVSRWQVYGVLLSTVLSTLFVGMPWLLYNLFHEVFDKEQLPACLKRLLGYAICTFGTAAITLLVCRMIPVTGLLCLAVRLFLCILLPNLIFLAIYSRLPEFGRFIQLVDTITKKKLHLTERLGIACSE